MGLDHVVELDSEHLAHAELGRAAARRRHVVDLEHEHVAAVAAAALQQPPRCGVIARR